MREEPEILFNLKFFSLHKKKRKRIPKKSQSDSTTSAGQSQSESDSDLDLSQGEDSPDKEEVIRCLFCDTTHQDERKNSR